MAENGKVYARQYAYETLRERILTCRYAPGELLNETALGEKLGVSRTPIREALGRLERESLVEILPKIGVRVTELSIADINEIYAARELIEPYIIEEGAASLDRRALMRVRDALTAQSGGTDEQEQYNMDSDLHALLLTANRNRYLAAAIDNVYAQNQRVRIMTGRRSTGRLAATREEHLAVVDAILLEQYSAAAEAMRRHLRLSKEAAIRSLLEG